MYVRFGSEAVIIDTSAAQTADRARLGEDASGQVAEIERIDAGVRRIRVPLHFSDQFYDLRGHIDLVRQRLAKRPLPTRIAAE